MLKFGLKFRLQLWLGKKMECYNNNNNNKTTIAAVMTQTTYFVQDNFIILIYSYRSNKYFVTVCAEIKEFGTNANKNGKDELQIFLLCDHLFFLTLTYFYLIL
jgi:hypothetical protein